MTTVDTDAALRAAQELLAALDARAVVISEAAAARLAVPLRDLIEQNRRNGGRIPGEIAAAADAFEAARRRRDQRAEVPQVPQPSVPQPEPARSSPHVDGHEVNVEDAAARLGITPRAVRKAIVDNRLEARSDGRGYLIALDHLEEFQELRNGRSDRRRPEGSKQPPS